MPVIAPAQAVDIPDPNLRTAIENFLRKAPGAEITVDDMARLAFFNAVDMGIRDLTGLEHAANLTSLSLGYNLIVDISPLAGLTQLEGLSLDHNSIVDISPLAGLTQLDRLWLDHNSIVDISPLAGLTQLKLLNLWENSIVDISPLAGLTQLKLLYLNYNLIADISPLAGLTQLTTLELLGNSIVDISSLAGLTQLTELYLWENSIVDISPLADLTQLEGLILNHNSIVDISPLAGLTQLDLLWLDHNSIVDISPLAGLTQLSYLQLLGNLIADLSPLVANTGLRNGDTVDVKVNPLSDASINTHIPALQSRRVTVRFDEPEPTPVVNSERADANSDGVVNILDLVLVSQNFGQAHPQADINGDGTVNILDLVFVAQHFGSTAGDLDIDPPMIVQGTVEDGSPFVDPVPINASGLQFEFNEAVSGSLKLTDEAGIDLNWLGTVAGRTATLTPVVGQEMDYQTIYKVEIDVMDGVGNSSLITITFATIPTD